MAIKNQAWSVCFLRCYCKINMLQAVATIGIVHGHQILVNVIVPLLVTQSVGYFQIFKNRKQTDQSQHLIWSETRGNTKHSRTSLVQQRAVKASNSISRHDIILLLIFLVILEQVLSIHATITRFHDLLLIDCRASLPTQNNNNTIHK